MPYITDEETESQRYATAALKHHSWACSTDLDPGLPRLLLCWHEQDMGALAVSTPTHHRQREAHEHHDGVVEHHEELLVQVASRHSPGAARGSGPPFVPSVPLDLVLVPVTEEHGVDVVDEVGHCKLCVGRGKPVSVGQREGHQEERR